MKTADFIIGKEAQVLANYGLELTRNKHIDCFICGKQKKLRIHEWEGSVRGICVCGSYSTIDLIVELTRQDFKTIAAEIDAAMGNNGHEPMQKEKNSKREKAIQVFKESQAVSGTEGHEYLKSRGIFTPPAKGVRYGRTKQGKGLIALATNEFMEPKMLHCTYLENGQKTKRWNDDGRRMYSLSPKNSNEPLAIKLAAASSVLGIAEGIETALSAAQLYKLPVWATMNSGFLEKFIAPTGVKKLYIFADNDSNGTGLAAAFVCGKKNILNSNDVESVVIRWPEKLNDFNDLIQQGDKRMEWVLK